MGRLAHEHDIKLHCDGARIFHAVAETGIPASEWAAPADTVCCCLSKGLGAPAG
jgi:threonine aldolase